MSGLSDNPLVSVVIATYNRPAYLRNAIASVLNGNYSNVEIIVADDLGSEANRKAALQFEDPRVIYHRNQSNLGMAANHIEAFRNLVSGELIALLNDDDEWGPLFLTTLVPFLADNPDIVLAFSDHYIINEQGQVDFAATAQNTHRWRRDVLTPGIHQPFWRCLLERTIPVAQASVIRRNSIDWHDFPAEVGGAYDQWLGYLACRTGKACYYHPERLTKYRVHLTSATATGSDYGKGLIHFYSRLNDEPGLDNAKSEIKTEWGSAHLSYGLFLMQKRRMREARKHLRSAIALQGLTPQNGLALISASMPGAFGSGLLETLRRSRPLQKLFRLGRES